MSKHGTFSQRMGYLVAAVALAVLVVATTRGAGSPPAVKRSDGGSRIRGRVAVAAGAADPTGCSTDAKLCLADGRFLVEASWKGPDGATQTAHAVPLTADAGYFWFLDPDNVEVAAKILNGCGTNGRSWFYAAGLTDREVLISVTDTATNEVKTYSSPAGIAFLPIADTSAFGCTGTAALSATNPEEPRRDALPKAAPGTRTLRRTDAELGCTGSDTVLCIDGRFQVEATWQSASGMTGDAHAVPMSSESGYFWFFDPSNVEMLVKTLNACGLERGNWFFGAGMTTVGVQLKVTDTFSGEARTYTNPAGTSFPPIQDTSTFAFCPTPTNTPTQPTPTPVLTATSTRTPVPIVTLTSRPTYTPVLTITPGAPPPSIQSAVLEGSTLEVRGAYLGGCGSGWTTGSFTCTLENCHNCQNSMTATCLSGSDTMVTLGGALAETCTRIVRVRRSDGAAAQHNY